MKLHIKFYNVHLLKSRYRKLYYDLYLRINFSKNVKPANVRFLVDNPRKYKCKY